MPFSGGTFNRITTWVADKLAGTKITAIRHDEHDNDIAEGLNGVLLRDGMTTPTADLDMGGYKITNVGAPVSNTDAAQLGDQIESGSIASGTITLTRYDGSEITLDIDTGYLSAPTYDATTKTLSFTQSGGSDVDIDFSSALAAAVVWEVVSSAQVVAAGDALATNVSSSGYTHTLPASVTVNDQFRFCVFATAGLNVVTLDLNGHTLVTREGQTIGDNITLAPGDVLLLIAAGTGTTQNLVGLTGAAGAV